MSSHNFVPTQSPSAHEKQMSASPQEKAQNINLERLDRGQETTIKPPQHFASLPSHLPMTTAFRKAPEPILRLRKCLIRPFYESDAEAITKEANNPEIARWMRNAFPQPYSIEDARKWIFIATSPSPLRDFAICELDRNTVIGGIGLKTRDDIHIRTMEVGYWLGESHWHKGIATEALFAFSKWTFGNFDYVLRIEAEVFEGNEGSARVLEKAGYVFEARKRKAVEKRGLVLDALTYCTFRYGS